MSNSNDMLSKLKELRDVLSNVTEISTKDAVQLCDTLCMVTQVQQETFDEQCRLVTELGVAVEDNRDAVAGMRDALAEVENLYKTLD